MKWFIVIAGYGLIGFAVPACTCLYAFFADHSQPPSTGLVWYAVVQATWLASVHWGRQFAKEMDSLTGRKQQEPNAR